MNKCLQCGKDFEAKRSTAKFDSVTCRVTYLRNSKKAVEPVSVTKKLALQETEVSVTKPAAENVGNSVSVEEVEKKPAFIPNWKRKGYASKEEAFRHILGEFINDRKTILKKGPSTADDFSVTFGERTFVIDKKGLRK